MFQHGSQIQTLDNQMNKFTAPAFPEKIKTLESIPETNRESYVDLSELSTQPNGIFPSPPKQGTGLSDMPQDRFTSPNLNHQDYVLPNINSQIGPPQTGFNYAVGYMGTQYGNVNNPNIQQTPMAAYSGSYKDNFYMQHNTNAQNMSQAQGINQLGPQTGTGLSSIPGSQQYIGSQSGYGFGSYNPINAQQTNVYENNQLGGGNVVENPSDMTDDTGDLSQMSIGNFKNAFHRKDNSYNLNLTKMDQSVSRTYSQPPTPDNQNVSQNFMKKNIQNMSSQPTDLLNMVNSNAFTGGNMQTNNVGQEAGANSKAVEKKARFKVREDSKDLEALIAQLDPLELSQIAPLSENFLDDDEDDHGAVHTKVLTKKHSKGKEEEEKKKEIENNNTTPPVTIQNLPVIKEEPTQYTYNSNYSSQPPVKTDTTPTQVHLNYSTQKLIENYQSNQSATGATTTTGLQIPNYGIETNIAVNPVGTYTTGYTVTSTPPSTFSYQHQFGYSQGIPRPTETTPTQSSYSLEPKDSKGYVSPYTPYTNEKQQLSTTMNTTSYLSPSPFNYMSNPTSAQIKPQTDFQSPYQVSSMNYMSGGTPSIQIIGSTSTPSSMNNLNTLNAFKPLKASQAPAKEYHNPFAPSTSSNTSNANMQTNQSIQYQNTPTASISQYQSAPVSRQQFNETGYQNTSRSPVHRAEEEADEIVNKMQSLYKDWKQKNAELNQYLNELVNTAATDHTFRKTVQGYSVQRNTLSSNDKSTLPYDFRYSVKVPSNRENFQAFMNEDFLQGVEQSDERKNNTSTKQEFKKFSNPIFDKSALSKEDNSILRVGHQRDSSKSYFAQEEANFPQRLSANSLQTPQRTQQGYDIKKDVSPRGTYGEQNMPSVQLRKERVSEGYEFKPKFTKHHHEHDIFNSSPPKSERLYNMESIDHRNKFNFPVNKYQAGYEHFKHTLFGFNVKKDRFIEGRNGRRINTEQMEIICMNCQEFIAVNEADRHSEMCNRFVRKMARNIEAFVYEDVKELNNKLRNIRQRIVTKFSSLPTKKSLEMKIKQAIRCIDNAINQNSDLNQLNFLIYEGEKLIDAISNDDLTTQEMSLLVYLNRFVVIMKEKYAEIQVNTLDHAEIEELQTKRHEYEREIQKQKTDMEELRERAQMMMNIQLSNKKGIYYVKTQYSKEDEVISQINSDIESVRDDDSNDALSMVSISLLPVEAPMTRSPAANARTEGGKIKFYSMVVNDKLLLPPSHPGKDILISDLYDECLELNLPEEQWEGFIRKKLGL